MANICLIFYKSKFFIQNLHFFNIQCMKADSRSEYKIKGNIRKSLLLDGKREYGIDKQKNSLDGKFCNIGRFFDTVLKKCVRSQSQPASAKLQNLFEELALLCKKV